ncbi:MAG: hypothetical protein ACREJO_18140 [Phycisphaerales bacterium]
MFAALRRYAAPLALTTLALSSAAMAGAGPKDFNLDIRIGGGDGFHRGYPRPRVIVPPPVIVRPPVVVYRPVETSPTALSLEAFQTDGTILIVARGENPYAGFNISLDHVSRHGRPTVTLHNIAPTFITIPAQVCTPFMLTGTIDRCPRLAEITVCIAGVERCIPVTQVGDIPRTW